MTGHCQQYPRGYDNVETLNSIIMLFDLPMLLKHLTEIKLQEEKVNLA